MKVNQLSKEWIVSEYPKTSRDGKKYRKEWNVLHLFLQHIGVYDNFDIEKGEHPDFVLSLCDERIGIEITEFTEQDSQIATRILENSKDKANTSEGLRTAAIRRHGKNAERFQYEVYEGSTSISIGFSNLTEHMRLFAQLVRRKYEKYCEDMDQYNEFYVLCNALDGIEITNETDAMHVVRMLDGISFEHRFNVAILYQIESTETIGCLICPLGKQ